MTKVQLCNNSPFEKAKHSKPNGLDYWLAHQLAELLGYKDFNNFLKVIEKGITACINSGQKAKIHFEKITGTTPVEDGDFSYSLSRYAVYLIVQNADPAKREVADCQAYIARKTRLRELNDTKDRNYFNQNCSFDAIAVHLRQELGSRQQIRGSKGTAELAFHLFCETQTDDRFDKRNTNDEAILDLTKDDIEKKVLKTIEKLGGVAFDGFIS